MENPVDNFELVVADQPRPPIGGTKRCPYCGGWHSKRDPAVYCCPDHAKRSQRLAAWMQRRVKRAERHHRAERAVADHWRAVIYGSKEPSLPPAVVAERERRSGRRAGKPHPPPGALEATPRPPDAL